MGGISPTVLADADILVIPGRGGSSAGHWQSHFERRHANARRVEQDHWDSPELDSWARRIVDAATGCERPVLAIAHSFGCLALAHAISTYGAAVHAALFVAPADPERFAIRPHVLAHRLDTPSLLLASDNDPWLSAWKAAALAKNWGSRAINLGLVGHINVASGFGDWPQVDAYAETALRTRSGDGDRPNLGFLRDPWRAAGPALDESFLGQAS